MNNHKFNVKCNVLNPIKSKLKTYDIHAFDIETHGVNNLFLLGGYYDNRYHSFLDKDVMHKHIMRVATKKTLIVATNLGFDYNALYFDSKHYAESLPIMRSGNIITVSLHNARFVDTMNYSPSSVEKLGKLLNIPKLNHPQFLGEKPKNLNEWKYLKKYNSKDCLISKRFVEQFQQFLNNELKSDLKLTIASTALQLYRRRYMKKPIYKEHMDCKEFVYESYYGGRTETFKRGSLNNIKLEHILKDNFKIYKKWRKYYYYDFNSLYPSVMVNKYPQPNSGKIRSNRKGNLTTEYIMKYEGVSNVLVTCPYMYYPILPYRLKDKLIFPYGKFRGTYTHTELRYALKNGYKILKCYKSLYYTKTFYPFKEYVNDLYSLRLTYQKHNNIIYATMIKMLMNSLYGKFATKNLQEIEFIDINVEGFNYKDLEGATMNWRDLPNGEVDLTSGDKGYKTHDKECNQNYVIPILSSYTTAYARIKLHKAMILLKPIYCDTDSLLSLKKIRNNTELGGLKLEKISVIGWIVKPKLYRLIDDLNHQDVIRVKGVRGMTKEMFNDILDNKRVKQLKFSKLKESIKRAILPNTKFEFFKNNTLEDTKRLWKHKFNKNRLQNSKPIYINMR